MKRIFLIIIAFLSVPMLSFGGHDKVVEYLQGSNIASGGTITTQDSWYSYITGNSNWSNRLYVKESWCNIIFRYDENSGLAAPTSDISETVEYSLKLFYESGTQTYAGTIDVEFNQSSNYEGYNLVCYTEGVSNYQHPFKAELTITNSPSISSDRILLELELGYERYFTLQDQSTPTVDQVNGPVSSSSPPNNTLPICWDFVEGAESYELEWVFVDKPDNQTTDPDYNFKNATRIVLNDNHYDIPLAYPEGIINYRVRPIGVEGTSTGVRKEGLWSHTTESGSTSVTSMYEFDGLEEDISWQYTVNYAENGKRKEVINFFDGSLRSRQLVTVMKSEDLAIIGESKYDYQGRPVVQMLPTPVTNQGIKFYGDINPGLTKANFDVDDHFDSSPATGYTGKMGSGDKTGIFYSSLNPNQTGFNAYIPDAEGYPYTQVVYYNDGSGRKRMESVPGDAHKIFGNHTTRYYYGTPSQVELDRLFGNEVGFASHYEKEMIVDANGQVSVRYLEQGGKAIATAIAGENPTNLLTCDHAPGAVGITEDLLVSNELSSNYEMVSTRTILVSSPGIYSFSYSLGTEAYSDLCMSGDATCMFDLEISITDENGSYVTLTGITNPYLQKEIDESFSKTFSASLGVGSYTIVKVVRLNQSNLSALYDDYVDNNTCYEYEAPDSVSCDCEDLCIQQYIGFDSNGDTIFYNASGSVITSAQCWTLIYACQAENCSTYIPELESECEVIYKALSIDMSPGGQYFDNIPGATDGKWDPTANDLIPNTNYDLNGWLGDQERYDGQVTLLSHLNTSYSTTYTSWDDVRDDWDPTYLDTLIRYHPEYSLYRCQCLLKICDESDQSAYFMADTWEYEEDMHQGGTNTYGYDEGYFVPYYLPSSFTPCSTATAWGDNTSYLPNTYLNASVTDYDPFFDCFDCDGNPSCFLTDSCMQNDSTMLCCYHARDRMHYLLTHFLHEGGGNCGTDYVSIWYVLDNPNNFVVSTPPSCAFDSLIALIHDPTDGVIGSGIMTEYEFFRMVYSGYKRMLIYHWLNNKPYCGNYLEEDSPGSGRTRGGYSIHFYPNRVFESFGDWCTPDMSQLATYIFNSYEDYMEEDCELACELEADRWISQLDGCMSTANKAIVRDLLIEMCSKCCNDNEGEMCDYASVYDDNSLQTFSTFDGVIAYYENSPNACPSIHQPIPEMPTCNCNAVASFVASLGYDFYDTADDTDATAALNTALNTTNISETEYKSLRNDCFNGIWDETYSSTDIIFDDFVCDTTNPLLGYDPITSCGNELTSLAIFQAQQAYADLVAAAAETYVENYKASCYQELVDGLESFTVTYSQRESMYTLYYYDQAGNLVKTVPPKGVNPLTGTDLTAVKNHRDDPVTYTTFKYPTHYYITNYQYTSLNGVFEQTTPDGGETEFWFDELGRMVASKNAKQQACTTNNNYSYTLYDELSRITEVGQVDASTSLSAIFVESSDLSTWQGYTTSAAEQITKTIYDSYTGIPGVSFTCENVRGRVASSQYWSTTNNQEHETVYSYDEHGNVKKLGQMNYLWRSTANTLFSMNSEGFKQMDYDYDLLSGNVNQVCYQRGEPDQFFHQYFYDSDNRITNVFTSTDSLIWQQDAKYFYYPHGPLARVELANNKSQAVDFIYTIMGWQKGVNSTILSSANDPGKDGNTGSNINRYVAQDAFSFSLGYYNNDYTPINASCSTAIASNLDNSTYNLYNGNISHMVSTIYQADPCTGAIDLNPTPRAYFYRYDQLNRLKWMDSYTCPTLLSTNSWQGKSYSSDYHTDYEYDKNGNIESLYRNANTVSASSCTTTYPIHNNAMDDLTYVLDNSNYTNKLLQVTEASTQAIDLNDIQSGQSANNYAYDEIGNLVSDVQGEIDEISWNVYGKVSEVDFASSAGYDNIYFNYDAAGNRICKKVVKGSTTIYKYYVKDATGNIMGVYEIEDGSSDSYTLTEQYMYGSSRLGIMPRDIDLENVSTTTPVTYVREIGGKLYELSNHLGNVLSVVSDRKEAQNSGVNVDYYTSVIKTAQDYYPFGMLMPGRTFSTDEYSHSFNGQEKDDEIYGSGNSLTAEFWQYDARLGRRWNLDPKPQISMSDYACFRSNPILLIDHAGDSTRYYFKGKLLGITHDSHPDAIVDYSHLEEDFVMSKYNQSLQLIEEHGVDKTAERLRKSGILYELKQFDDYMNECDLDEGEASGYGVEHLSYTYLRGDFENGFEVHLGTEDIRGDEGTVDRFGKNADGVNFGQNPTSAYYAKATIHNHVNSGKPAVPNPLKNYADPPSGPDRYLPDSQIYHMVYSPSRIYFFNGPTKPLFPMPRKGERFKKK